MPKMGEGYMKILITGGCGFIGSHVANRFYKEGHKIYIIDNLSTGNIKNVEVSHKFYNLDIASKDCEDIFKANRFDAVINLSAQVDVKTSIEAPFLDSKSNLLGITNMLDLSHKYGVKRFIFASSAAVYGNTDEIPIKEDAEINPISPYGMSKHVGEYYCKKWFEIYGLKTMCFRFSNVYGPKQGLKGESGVISIFMDKLIKNQELIIFGDGNQTRDFIYVEDIADGIYKAFESDYTGVLNLATNTQHTLNELIDNLKEFHPIKKVTHKESRLGDIRHSRLDNTKVKEILKWSPKYSFKAGIEKTYKWYEKYYNTESSAVDEVAATSEKESKKSLLLPFIPYFENLLGILLIVFLNFYVLKNTDVFSSNNFMDICYIYIVIFSVMYGMTQSFIAIVFSSVLYLYTLLSLGYGIVGILYEPSNLIHIASYIIIGIMVGYASDVNNRKLFLDKLKIDSMQDKYNFLELIFNETRTIKEDLEDKIISSEDSFASMYNATKALDSFELDNIYSGAMELIGKLLKNDTASIYTLSKDEKYLRLKAKSPNENFSLPYSVNLDEFSEIRDVVNNKTIFINRNINNKLPIMMAPVVDDGKTVAVISIHEFKFENLTLYYENLFKVLVDLISSAISKAHKYDKLAVKDKYIPNTEILVNTEFNKTLVNKIKGKETSGMDFILLKIMDNNYSQKENFEKLSTSIRDDDLIGIGPDNGIYSILSNTDEMKAKKVLARLSTKGINARIVEE